MDEYQEEEHVSISSTVYNYTFGILENYGWYIVIVAVIVAYIYNKKAKDYIEQYRQKKFEEEYAAKYHKNPDLFAAHQAAQEARTARLQEKYNQQRREFEEKEKEKEAKKREEMSAKYGRDGYVLGRREDENDNSQIRPESLPLMGGGSSSNYRPPRRSACGGGGCGR